MTSRARVLRLVVLVVVLAVAGGIAVALSRGEAPTALGPAAPVQGPVESPTPAATDEAAVAAGPEATEVEPSPTSAPEDDPATVFVEDDFDELPPVDLDEEADYGNDVTVTLDKVERVDGTGAGPGEVAGPSVLVTVSLRNGSTGDVDLGAVVVDLYTATGALGTPLYGDERTKPFEGVAATGDAVTATYVVRVPDDSTQIKVSVSYEAETPAVTFLGEV